MKIPVTQVTDIEVTTRSPYPEYSSVILHFKDGEKMVIGVGSVMYDQFSSTPTLTINGRTSPPQEER